MKIFLHTAVLFLFSVFALQAQLVVKDIDEGVISNDTITIHGTPDQDFLKVIMHLSNTGETNLHIAVRKVEVSIVEGMSNNFCWNSFCYSNNVYDIGDINADPIVLEPGNTTTDDDFYTELWPDGKEGLSTVIYEFYDVNDVFETVSVTVNFKVSTATSIFSRQISKNSLGEASPNPAREFTNIPFEVPADAKNTQLVVRNLLGNIVYQQFLDVANQKIRIDTSGLSSGIYIYSLTVDNQTIASKRLMVTH